jgi:pyruvate kinase
LLDDGAIEVIVEKADGLKLHCRVANSGTLGNKKGVNMPGTKVLLPAISDKDKADLRWGVTNDVDCIAASFIRKASDVTEIRDFLRPIVKDVHGEGHPLPQIISKSEYNIHLEFLAHINTNSPC